MILVTGATGKYGSAAIEHLIKKGVSASHIAALVRDADKAEHLKENGVDLRIGNYTNYESLVSAFKDVDKLLLVSSNDRGSVENRTAHHINVIKAASAAQVKHIVYTSFVRRPNFEDSAIAAFQNAHVQTEQAIKESNIPYTILQNGIYLEMIPIFAGEKVAQNGVIMFPAGEGKASWLLRDELAEAAAHVLTTEGHENKTYPLTNLNSASFEEIARELSATLGKNIQYHSPAIDSFQFSLTQAGVPPLYIGMLSMWATAQAEGALDLNDSTLAAFLGRSPTTVKQFINQVYS